MDKARIARGGRRKDTNRVSHYLIGIGSNQPLSRTAGPREIVEAALADLDRGPFRLVARSPVIASRPMGPSRRTYANAAALIATDAQPLEVLDRLHHLERAGKRRRARRWGSRTLDLDILLWDGGIYATVGLLIPHPAFRTRSFVLGPLRALAPRWRDPVSRLSIAQLAARLAKAKPVDPTPRPR